MSGSPAATAASDRGAGTFGLAAAGDGRYTAAGPLTFATARRAAELGAQLVSGASGVALEIDCAGVTASDSAGLAVVIDWLAAAKRAGRALRCTQLPPGLTALARISDVEELLDRGV